MKKFLRSPSELGGRLLQKLYASGERVLPAVFLRAYDSKPVAPNAARNVQSFFLEAEEVNALRQRALAVVDVQRIVSDAEAIAEGKAPIFGHGFVDVGRPPRWHHEPVAHVDAPRVHWSRIDYLNPEIVGDHKTLWEFNRHQYLVTLAQAFVLTGDERWVQLIADDISNWIEENPPGVGVNWASSLEVAYRAIAWCWTLRFVADAPVIDDVLMGKIVASMAAHARHVERYLSTWFSPNTHLTGEALGLLYIGRVFPELPQSAHWRSLGAQILEQELPKQVMDDGVYFEQASQYHRYTAEIFLHYLQLKGQLELTRNDAEYDRIEMLFDVLMHLSRSDGTMALVGDDDGGLLLPLDGEPPHQLRGLLGTAGAFFSRPEFIAASAGKRDHAVWMLDAETFANLDSIEPHFPEETSAAFRQGGVCVMRDCWEGESGHVTIDAGPHGALSCGHSHADALAVELFAGGAPLFVDSGTYTYVGEERNTFRGTAAHNTVVVDDRDSSIPTLPFKWASRADATIDEFLVEGDASWFAGSHDGYRDLADPVTHRRGVLHPVKGVWIIEDVFDCNASHTARMLWHSHPSLSVGFTSHENGVEFCLSRDDSVATALVLGTNQGKGVVVPHRVSQQFGRNERSSSCIWETRLSRDAAVVTIVIDWAILNEQLVTLHGVTATPVALRHPSPRSGGEHIFRWKPFAEMSSQSRSQRLEWTVRSPEAVARVSAGPGLRVDRAIQETDIPVAAELESR